MLLISPKNYLSGAFKPINIGQFRDKCLTVLPTSSAQNGAGYEPCFVHFVFKYFRHSLTCIGKSSSFLAGACSKPWACAHVRSTSLHTNIHMSQLLMQKLLIQLGNIRMKSAKCVAAQIP